MKISEIRDTCIGSAETYLKFMEDNDKGYEEVEITSISKAEGFDSVYKLRLGKKLFDIEAISFKCLINNQTYNTEEIKVVEYDPDSNLLLVRPEKELEYLFLTRKPNDLKLISDLKFLVKNVQLWFEQNGVSIKLPTNISVIDNNSDNIKFLENLTPSQTQKESLESIFNNPFTYVWGAPGTGKTQFVLAYSALHYINNDKRIAIMAPTNNALEQVLRGVIKMTDLAGIERNKILRLGNPTKKFAEEYPEVCEERGIQKAIKETNNKLERIERVLKFVSNTKKLNELEDRLNELSKLSALKIQKDIINDEFEKLKLSNKLLEIESQDLNNSIKSKEIELQNKTKRKNSLKHKLKKLFSSSDSNIETEINSIEDSINILNKENSINEFKLSESNQKLNDVKKSLNSIDDSARSFLEQFILLAGNIESLSLLCKTINLDNWKSVNEQIIKSINEEKEKLLIDKNIHQEYEQLTSEEMENLIKDINKEKEKLLAASPDTRIASVNVIACTLDSYIGRFRSKKLDITHIFLDEAGYANMTKTLTLFHNEVPITFLGDHMQLPPVCEINDLDIQRVDNYKNMYLWAQSSLYLESLFSKSNNEMRSQYLNNETPEFKKMIKTSLVSTFRFGSNMAKILDQYVYNIGLISSDDNTVTTILSAHATKNEGNKSRESVNEVFAIKDIILKRNPSDYIILTPYKKQVRLLGRHLPSERNNLKILTVHGSQGREWDTVILSVADTGDKWFVDSKNNMSRGLNLLNTAVSRAKKELIIVCDMTYWKNQNGQLICELLSESEKIN